MHRRQTTPARLRAAAMVAIAGLGLAGCGTTEAMQRAEQDTDARTCEDFGNRYGSREYSDCMLVQQQRRDAASLDAAEKQRISAETARNNVEMVELIRCRREAKRDEEAGQRPRRC